MAESGLLTEVRWEWDGTEVVADALLGATDLVVLATENLTVDEAVWISETGPYTVTFIDEETGDISITPGLLEDMEEGDPVVPDAGGVPAKYWVAEVILQDSDGPIEVPLVHTDLLTMPEGVYDPPVSILLSDDLQHVLDLPNQTPLVPQELLELPEGGQGTPIFRDPEPPWPEGTADQPDNALWYDTDHPDGITPFLWDATSLTWIDASDPQVDVLEDPSQILVGDLTLEQIAQQSAQAAQTATSARNLASTADGRVSFSDYDPLPEDVQYYVTNADGSLGRGPAFDIQQAALTSGVATLTLADEGMAMGDGEYIVIEGIGFPFDGEEVVLSKASTLIEVTDYAVTGTLVTLTLASGSPWTAGQRVIISGVDAAVNGNYDLASSAGTTVTYNLPTAPGDVPTTALPESGSVAVYTVQYRIPGEADEPLFAVPDAALGYNTILQNRVEGSVWYTRTRARKNLVANPSFEVDLTGWSASAASLSRIDPVAPAEAVAGDWVARVTNDATTGDHYAEWAGGSPGMPVNEGETYAATGFALLESGSGAGAFASMRFYAVDGVTVVDEIEGAGTTIVTDDWVELKVSATVPPGAATVSAIRLHNPNPSAVWQIDAALVEPSEYTGRYFDGDQYDSVWGNITPDTVPLAGDGTPHASFSTMEGGKIITVWELADGNWNRLDFTGTTTYDADASDLTQGYLAPARLADNTIPMDKLLTNSIQVADAVEALDLVNIFQVGTVFQIRPADASLGREAHGFVYEGGAAGAVLPVYSIGFLAPLSGLTPGPIFLGDAGEVAVVPPQGTGKVVQVVGVASDATTLQFMPQTPTWLV